MDPGMNQLLKWSIENSEAARNDPSAATDPKAERSSGRPLNQAAINSIFGGPSDSELMKHAMAVIESPDASLDNKLIAFDNFEQLIEIIDNANNMGSLGLWSPLVGQLESKETDLRRMAAWCLGTAVQNNVKAQERLLAMGSIPLIIKLALEDASELVRRKAIYAISSEIRNYQPACDIVAKALLDKNGSTKVDAGDMDAVDELLNKLRDRSA
ncbi:MAG: hypothetical protein Q9167_004978 [Letrouitia subvulpina]